MEQLRRAIQVALSTNLPNREIGRLLDMNYNTIRRYRQVAIAQQYCLDALMRLDDDELRKKFNRTGAPAADKVMPSWAQVHAEMQKKDMTLQLLWEEYRQPHADKAYSYTQFTCLYRKWEARHTVRMRLVYEPGDRGFVDFAGRTIPWVDASTGEVHHAQVFVAALGYSSYIFASAVPSQALEWWIECHRRWFACLGGVPRICVPDNLKSAVIRAGSDPVLNATYRQLADHYGTVILPARPRKPKDKAKAEVSVQLVTRWAIARLRNRTFFSLAEINVALAECVAVSNSRVMREYGESRQQRFEQVDRPKLLPLPAAPFAYAEWQMAIRVPRDYHIDVRGHHYSAPHTLVHEKVNTRVTATTVEVFHKHTRVASHARNHQVGGTTTDPAHQPPSHRAWSSQTPDRCITWARSIGAKAHTVVTHLFECAPHPGVALKACYGLQRLSSFHGVERFEAACGEALRIKSPTLKSIRSLLQNRIERRGSSTDSESHAMPKHSNVRGAGYYQQEDDRHAA